LPLGFDLDLRPPATAAALPPQHDDPDPELPPGDGGYKGRGPVPAVRPGGRVVPVLSRSGPSATGTNGD
jgi:hypothetical protein